MVAFMTLWNSYPADQYPCSKNNVPQFENQCAIRLGVCFQTAGVSTDHWPVARCWHHPRKDGHTIRAEDLAKFFDGGTVAGLGQTEKYDGKVAFPKYLHVPEWCSSRTGGDPA